eukprot:gene16407-22616_t
MSNWVFLASGIVEGAAAVMALAGDSLKIGPGLGFMFPEINKSQEGEMAAALCYTGAMYNWICAGALGIRLMDDSACLPGPAPTASGNRHFVTGVVWVVIHVIVGSGFLGWIFGKSKKKQA